MAQNSASVRVGRISSINYLAGTVRVTYADRDDMVTQEIPMISNEYNMPKVGDMVQVNHLSNGGEMGVVCGVFWNEQNTPYEGKEGLYRKEFSKTPNTAFFRFAEDEGKKALCKIPKICVEAYEEGAEIEFKIGSTSIKLTKDKIEISAKKIFMNGEVLEGSLKEDEQEEGETS